MLFADFVKWILKKIIFFKSTYIDAIRNEVSCASGGVWKPPHKSKSLHLFAAKNCETILSSSLKCKASKLQKL